ncbi:hypothetical protein [Protofrankia symbiont of Coriaria ruscifolia]|uniref:hypothetical protein n=1 Tax=Protofrankia symbiont of Coriaria ruscifolia TaxID=1306542 RepID=UPI0010418CE9|nr:hypothetical protein [Protofrankia symbiont of Coriaria ruscifolia]
MSRSVGSRARPGLRVAGRAPAQVGVRVSSRRRASGWWLRLRANPWLGAGAGAVGAVLIVVSLYLHAVGGGQTTEAGSRTSVLTAVTPVPSALLSAAPVTAGVVRPTPTVRPPDLASPGVVPPGTTDGGPVSDGGLPSGGGPASGGGSGSRPVPHLPQVIQPHITPPTAVATTTVTTRPSPARTDQPVQPQPVQPQPVHTESPPPTVVPLVTPTPSTGVPVPTPAADS